MNQTRPHCVNQMGKRHSKPLAARHGRGRAWARHAMCESAFSVIVPSTSKRFFIEIPDALPLHQVCHISRPNPPSFRDFIGTSTNTL